MSGAEIETHQLRSGPVERVRLDGNPGAQSQHRAWYRGPTCHRLPDDRRMIPTTAVRDWVLKGWAPEAPMIDRQTRITAFGSCFAANISAWLGHRNYRVAGRDSDAQKTYVVDISEGLVNSFVIRQQFEWAWENKVFDGELWHGYKAEAYGYDEAVRQDTKALFDRTDLFILTFGLSEVWYDAPTGNVFWRTIPKDVHDPERHQFRVSTVEENRANIRAIYDLIRTHRPEAKIIVTLSPVPLIATFRDNSCITSNSVSKAVLRVAVDEVLREVGAEGHLFYWPSYEIVNDVFPDALKEDRRHVKRKVLNFIMTQFEHVWCRTEEGDLPSLSWAWILANAETGRFPPRLARVLEHKNPTRLRHLIATADLGADPERAEAIRGVLRGLEAEWAAEDTGNARAAAE